jgi:putative Holliday junction resolvase
LTATDQPIMRVMGFDHGDKRIGVAVGNCLTQTCQGIAALSAKAGVPEASPTLDLIKTWKPDRLIVGLPLDGNGQENDACKKVRRFGRYLRKLSSIDVDYMDERLTSASANALLSDILPGKRLKHKHKYRDSLAAELILNTYFDTINHE